LVQPGRGQPRLGAAGRSQGASSHALVQPAAASHGLAAARAQPAGAMAWEARGRLRPAKVVA
jgi:hypothetical protein